MVTYNRPFVGKIAFAAKRKPKAAASKNGISGKYVNAASFPDGSGSSGKKSNLMLYVIIGAVAYYYLMRS